MLKFPTNLKEETAARAVLRAVVKPFTAATADVALAATVLAHILYEKAKVVTQVRKKRVKGVSLCVL